MTPLEQALHEHQEGPSGYYPELTLTAYQVECYRYAQWTGPGASDLGGLSPAVYCTLGIAGEAGEFADKMKKICRDGMTNEAVQGLKLVLGDVLWYVGQAAKMLGWTLGEVAEANLQKLADRRARGVLRGSGDDR